MFNTILTGIFIGICVSAPVGPLGILCIQRTISRGRWHGIVTGLGATTSDLIYALLVGYGMTFIVSFIETHQTIIQIAGSVIIGIFGLQIFFKKPQSRHHRKIGHSHPVSKGDLFSDYITAFALCFSNPLIIFLFIGLFARFSIIESANPVKTITGMTSILLGATLWWFILTMLIGIFRDKFKERGLSILNKITGSVLTILSIAGIITAI